MNSSLNESYTYQNYTSDFDDERQAVSDFRLFGIIIGIFDIVIGSFGNFFTILAFTRCKALHTPYNVFIVNLSIIDFLTATCMMPLNVTGYILKRWPLGGPDHISCSIQAFVYFCCGYTSIVCLLVITINRFIIIIYRDLYIQVFSKRNVLILSVLCWLVAPLFMLPLILHHGGKQSAAWNPEQFLCTFMPSKMSEKWKSYMLFCRILFQFMPAILMTSLYTTIFLKVREQEQLMSRYTYKQKPLCHNPIYASDELILSDEPRNFRDKIRRLSANFNRSFRKASVNLLNQHQPPNLPSESSTSNSQSEPFVQKNSASHDFDSANTATTILTATTNGTSSLVMSVAEPSSDSGSAALTGCNRKQSLVSSPKSSQKQIKPKDTQKKRADVRLLICSVTICTIFMLLFLPSVLINVIKGSIDPRLHMAASNVTWLNSCVNPIIYAMMNTRFRKEYIKLMKSMKNFFCRSCNEK